MSDVQITDHETAVRALKPALFRGLRWRCPACGEGKLFTSYLKVVKNCPCCGEDFSHQRADDGPAYITMLIVCHIAGFLVHSLFLSTNLSPFGLAAVVAVVVIPLSLAILPCAKGFLVAMQWAKQMHGFGKGRMSPD